MIPSAGRTATLAMGLVFGAAVSAQHPTGSGYLDEQQAIELRYRAANAACAALAGNAVDICEVTASGVERVAAAELEARYDPSGQNHYEVQIARAEAVHAIAEERCDDVAGDAVGACLVQATAVQLNAQSEAEVRLAIFDADALAATAQDARYLTATARCKVYTDGARDACLVQAMPAYTRP